jgi:hypothetical protein
VHTKVQSYNGFELNDIVSVSGLKGNFIFKGAALDSETHRPLWISVVGPMGNDRMWRSFTPDKVKPLTKAKRLVSQSKHHVEKAEREVAKAQAGPTPARIRSWAAQNGFTVSPKGRIPAEVREAYSVASGSTPGYVLGEKLPVREWAKAKGLKVGAKGRIPAVIQKAYDEAPQ